MTDTDYIIVDHSFDNNDFVIINTDSKLESIKTPSSQPIQTTQPPQTIQTSQTIQTTQLLQHPQYQTQYMVNNIPSPYEAEQQIKMAVSFTNTDYDYNDQSYNWFDDLIHNISVLLTE